MFLSTTAYAGYEYASVGFEDVKCAFETNVVKDKCYQAEGEKKTGEFSECFSPKEAECRTKTDNTAVSKCMKSEMRKCCHKVGGKFKK